jgi:hypothetical protein
MSVLGASRFTALLAAVAISGTAGTFWWAVETRSDMKAAAGNRGMSRALPPKLTGRVTPRLKDEPPAKAETGKDANKFELMGRSERVQPTVQISAQPSSLVGAPGQSGDQDPASDRPSPTLANYPSPGPSFQSRGLTIPSLQGSSSQNPTPQTSSPQSALSQGSSADMPLPALPAQPPAARPGLSPWQAMAPDSPMLIPPLSLPAPPQPAENAKRHARDARPGMPAAARTPKPQAPVIAAKP